MTRKHITIVFALVATLTLTCLVVGLSLRTASLTRVPPDLSEGDVREVLRNSSRRMWVEPFIRLKSLELKEALVSVIQLVQYRPAEISALPIPSERRLIVRFKRRPDSAQGICYAVHFAAHGWTVGQSVKGHWEEITPPNKPVQATAP